MADSIHQRCVTNPRYSRLPQACSGTDRDCVCSNFDNDFRDYIDGIAYNNDKNGDGVVDYYPVKYLFCSDERTNDLSWCTREDVGESFQEVIDNFRRSFDNTYPTAYFRRYRANGAQGGASIQSVINAAKIYQHLFFRYYYEPGFTSQVGPLGLNDQYLASVDAMNWFVQLATMPDVGSYSLDSANNMYVQNSEDLGQGDLDLPMGQGFYTWSKYQDGFMGFFRQDRAGVFYDKYIAMLALAIRDWGFSYTYDERFYINFFDLFPVEMTEFFGGEILQNPHWFAPRLDTSGSTPTVVYPTWWRSQCGSNGAPCRGPQAAVYPQPAIQGTSDEILRDWATILSLAQFPVFYDTSFEDKLSIWKIGNGDGHTIPDVQTDGRPTQAYGSAMPGSGHAVTTDSTQADYIVYTSDRLHEQYVAVKSRSRFGYNLEEEQLGFQLLLQMSQTQDRIHTLKAIASPTAAQQAELTQKQQQLQKNESFLQYLIQIQRDYGISSYL